jgi:ABC-type glycerol-3-phosphate transport system substrate-binding protein
MKKTLIAFAMVAALMMSACGSKPNYDDPKAVAKFKCDKMKEIMELMKTESEGTEAKIDAISKEVEDYHTEFTKHHGANAEAMEKKVSEAEKEVCGDLANAF